MQSDAPGNNDNILGRQKEAQPHVHVIVSQWSMLPHSLTTAIRAQDLNLAAASFGNT